jgi:hypothetical protein
MPKSMKYRDLVAKLRKLGCTGRPGKGDHEIWSCCAEHSTVIVHDTNVSTGLVVMAARNLKCLPKEWWL